MRVAVQPDYGARVVSLFDKQVQREWIFGGRSTNIREDRSYGASDPMGWDECFPTVMPWDASGTMWGHSLRDHGELWGRKWSVNDHTSTSLSTSYATPAFRFSRQLSIAGATLMADYHLQNLTPQDMPYLWALHGLFAGATGDRIVLPSGTQVNATSLVMDGGPLAAGDVPWPDAEGRLPFALDNVEPASRKFAGKFYARQSSGAHVALGREGEWLQISCDPKIDCLGIWMNYGGWQKQPGTLHLGLEPTTSGVDHLGDALDANSAAWIAAGGTITNWHVTFELARSLHVLRRKPGP